MCKKKGRTARFRKRKARENNSATSFCDNEDYRKLLQWMKKKFRFSSKLLEVASFPETGRGISARKAINCGETVISIPRCALIGSKEALEDSILLKSFSVYEKQNEVSNLSKVQILCTYLIEEKRKLDLFLKSNRGPYINVLPKTFTHPFYWSNKILPLLPPSLRHTVQDTKRRAEIELDHINNLIASSRGFNQASTVNRELSDVLCAKFSVAEYKWAWCCVNTRCVYSNHEESASCIGSGRSSSDNFYLVPFLDLLNHSGDAVVNAKFNFKTNCFEIVTLNRIPRFEQVYIHYGDHSNAKLLTEYGFVSTNDINKNDVVSITWAEIALLHQLRRDEEKQLSKLVTKRSFHVDCCFAYNGPSWSLIACLLAIYVYRHHGGFYIMSAEAFKCRLQDFKPKIKQSLGLLASMKTSFVREMITRCDDMVGDLDSSSDRFHLNLVASYWKIWLNVLASSSQLISSLDLCEYDQHLFM